MNYAIIEDGHVVNIVVSDGPLEGFHMVEATDCRIGDQWNGTSFITPSPTITKDQVIVAVQEWLDKQARSRGYDDIRSLCSYTADDPNQSFAAEGAAGRIGRSNAWTYCYAQLALVESGERSRPETIADFISEMNPIEWPS